MKKKLISIVIVIALIFGFCFAGFALNEDFDSDSIYAELVVIIDIDRVNHEVFAKNANGITIKFEEDDDWYIGDYAVAVFKSDSNFDIRYAEVVRVFYERPDLVAQYEHEIH